MNFDKKLSSKILDPVHGTIMLTDIERKVIDHPLFQRLRNVRQNTFLYKVFPSAIHTRFEHSLGVMHISYLMIKNLQLNTNRHIKKHPQDDQNGVFRHLDLIEDSNIQELRLAALLHDVGHGPMSHQFDNFLMNKPQLSQALGSKFSDLYQIIKKDEVEHEHISIIFITKIIEDLKLENEFDIDNIIKIIESDYKNGKIDVMLNQEEYDIQPILSSLISSCPIDSDRMDYLLRDSYFSGVKCGYYNIERLLKSIVPVLEDKKVYLAYKESSLDSISEFVFSRSSLFSQVYYHKTNRAFSAMLSKACESVLNQGKDVLVESLYNFDDNLAQSNLQSLEDFYTSNSDYSFINKTVSDFVEENPDSKEIIENIIKREPWKKEYEYKEYFSSLTINDSVDKIKIETIKSNISQKINDNLKIDDFIVDIVTDNSFKDINKTKIKLLKKDKNDDYKPHDICSCSKQLDMYQTIRFFIRVFSKKPIDNEKKRDLKMCLDQVIEPAIKDTITKA
ncbi:HD domain-containing protein [Vibrio pectenicida]|uniref:HD domain-containing protein n=1 Tax=Vibrio pectenicida TaxID=62763 RepID=UPI003B9BF1FD